MNSIMNIRKGNNMEKIALVKTETFKYPLREDYYRPDTPYPEYPFQDISKQRNVSYESVRECLALLELDKDNIGKPSWNPLGEYVKPGDSVLIKPNLVMDFNENKDGGVTCLYTNPSLVAAVVDYVLIALDGKGTVVIGDAPMQECDFEKLLQESGYAELLYYYKNKGLDVTIVDFRELSSEIKHGVHYATIRSDAKGKIVSLGEDSDFSNLSPKALSKLRVPNYDPRILPHHHNEKTHEYYISDYILNADVIINMPKPKTHRKAGVTISLKNFVGANVRKEFLPHHSYGSAPSHGDEYNKKNLFKSIRSFLVDRKNILVADQRYIAARVLNWPIRICHKINKLLCKDITEYGCWYGNTTLGRTISDINKIILYANKNGQMKNERQRKLFIVADLIISGEKEGPVSPSPKNVGLVAAGSDQLLFDETITLMMGFDPKRIPTFRSVRYYSGKYQISSKDDNVIIVSNNDKLHNMNPYDVEGSERLNYVASSGWKGYIEV